jgi:hypothetical protein
MRMTGGNIVVGQVWGARLTAGEALCSIQTVGIKGYDVASLSRWSPPPLRPTDDTCEMCAGAGS